MRHSVSGSALLAALTVIQGCSVSDTLTPPLDVGTSGSISSSGQLTRADIQTALEQDQTVYNAPLRNQTTTPAYASPPQQIASADTSPQNSLDAQAQALRRGYNPAASTPLDRTPVHSEAPRQQTRARKPVENHSAAAEQPAPAQQDVQQSEEAVNVPTEAEPASPALSPHQQASTTPNVGQPNAIRFLPIIGAPPQIMMPLSRQLGAEAREKGLILRDSNGEPAQHILKGYFSAYADNNRTVVVYVWDVLDANGNRLHRIQGQETVPGKAKDPWASVPASTMQIIATKTIEDYQEWQSKTAG